MNTTKTAFEILDSATIRLWDRYVTAFGRGEQERSSLIEAYYILADIRDSFPEKSEAKYWHQVSSKLGCEYHDLKTAIKGQPHTVGGDDGTICTWNSVKYADECTSDNCIWMKCQ